MRLKTSAYRSTVKDERYSTKELAQFSDDNEQVNSGKGMYQSTELQQVGSLVMTVCIIGPSISVYIGWTPDTQLIK